MGMQQGGERENLVTEIKGQNLIKGEWECCNINKRYKKGGKSEKSRRDQKANKKYKNKKESKK